MIVVDASLMVDALTDDGPAGAAAQAELAADPRWAAPGHLQVEVTSAVRGRWLAGQIEASRADGAVRTLNHLAVSVADWNEIGDRVWELRHEVTPYDAAYLATAEIRDCTLVTTDGKLLGCRSRRCDVRVVRPGG